MINAILDRCKVNFKCDGCGCEILEDAPYWCLDCEATINDMSICEDCGNELQNNLSQEYKKFIDLNK